MIYREVIDSLSRHSQISPKLLSKIKQIPPRRLENLGSDLAKEAVSMSREVEGDLHSHKAFLRFNISPHGILFAESEKMQHFNEAPLLKFFKNRFPTFVILFKSKRGTFALINNLDIIQTKLSMIEALNELENALPFDPILGELQGGNFHELWQSFASSQIIPNKKVSKQILSLSKKWQQNITVAKSHSKPLEEFFR